MLLAPLLLLLLGTPSGLWQSDAVGDVGSAVRVVYEDDNFAEDADDALAHLHVATEHPAASDDNPGTEEEPLATLQEGLARALVNRQGGVGTHLWLHPGIYRESYTGYFEPMGTSPIVLEATEKGAAVVSGSDVWDGWRCEVTLCSHAWFFDWGFSPNPWEDDGVALGPLGLRREMLFVNGAPLTQTLSLEETAVTPGSFYVDEMSDRVYLRPPDRVTLAEATVEVAVRPVLFRPQGLDRLVLKGLVFQHAATPLPKAAVDIVDARDVALDDVRIVWNNWNGLSLKGENLRVRGLTANHNGASGVEAFEAHRLLLTDGETSYNNWRGAAGGLTGWSVGQKFNSTRGLVIRRHTSKTNLSRGLWLDTDNADALLEGVTLCDNARDGLFIEANQGPVTVVDSVFCDNNGAGILTSSTHQLRLEGNLLSGNAEGQLKLSGDLDRAVTDHETGETYLLNNRDWSVLNNVMVGHTGAQLLLTTTLPGRYWDGLMKSLVSNENRYYNRDAEEVFELPDGTKLTLRGWQEETRQDRDSTFSPP